MLWNQQIKNIINVKNRESIDRFTCFVNNVLAISTGYRRRNFLIY